MAIKVCAPTALTSGTAVTLPETTAITAADTVTIVGGAGSRLLLLLNNTFAGAKEFTIKAGVNPPALRKGLGDLVISVPEKVTQAVVVETARFADASGLINITFQSGTTGFVSALRLPKGA